LDRSIQIAVVRQYRRDGKTFDDFARDLRSFRASEEEIQAGWSAYDRLCLQIRQRNQATTLKAPGLETLLWYDGPLEGDHYWPALKHELVRRGWKPEAIDILDTSSTRIVSFLQAPGSAAIQTRGLVIGYVQSGKTASYSAVIAKAADAGYRLVIVLSGLTDQLRNQTQRRLDDEFLHLSGQNQINWHALTTVGQDFQIPAGTPGSLLARTDLRLLAVVKKNGAVLRRLLKWLSGALKGSARACPVLIIDDEADQASVNASTTLEKRTAINHLIIQILKTMPRTAYIGYTATPFAHVFIELKNNEDLYPTDFIIDLPHSPDYFGAERIFGRELLPLDEQAHKPEGLDMIRLVPDDEIDDLKPALAKDRESFLPTITATLEAALCYFWMATAARRARSGKKEHSSMLIHTTLYADVHSHFRPLLSQFQAHVCQQLKEGNRTLLNRLRRQWEEEQQLVPSQELGLRPVSFATLLPELLRTIHETDIVVENGCSSIRLDYTDEQPETVVVVGGNMLSRGLTLEGLIVSFFVRAANAYDTLLQMGRWFGYRHGYEDLPRIWMTAELRDFFFDMATVEQEIRQDIKLYELEDLSPAQFGARVRTHPSLEITSRLKMQRTALACEVSFADSFHQTILFHHTHAPWLKRNLSATCRLIHDIRQAGILMEVREHNTMFRGVAVHSVKHFLQHYQFHELNRAFSSELITRYIDEQNRNNDLQSWNVVVVTRARTAEDGPETLLDLGLPSEVPLLNRSRLVTARETEYASLGVIAHGYRDIVSDMDLPDELLKKAKVPELRAMRTAPVGLLLIYPIDKNSTVRHTAKPGCRYLRADLHAVEHLIGIALAFPRSSRPVPQAYMTSASIAVWEEEATVDIEEEHFL